jgi:hypothetical protein
MAARTGVVHSEWLALVDTSGPFLTLPVLARALPNGLDQVPPELAREVARAYGEWQADPALHGAWVRWVLTGVLGFDTRVLADGPAVPDTLNHRVAEHGEILRPDLAVLQPAGGADAGRPRLLVAVWPAGTPLDQQIEDRWAAAPRERLAELLRAKDVRVGLVTNGDHWTLVSATREAANGYATWDAAIWLDDRVTLAAFRTLLGAYRFFGVAKDDTLEDLLAQSVDAQQEVTDQLGFQVRRAVEMLVDALSRADRESGGELLARIAPEELYQAAVTVMMRLVFLLSAEERDLLFRRGDELYEQSYALSTLRVQLQAEADRFGEEPLEKRHAAWHRLLATFRMVHGGVHHEDLRLPAYGGSLFDPDRYPFLEGRQPGQPWREHPASPVEIDDRTVLHLLDALQVLRRHGRGGPLEAQRLSYRALDVEQIGHVYEGLLDHTAVRVDEVALGLEGREEPEIALRTVEREHERGEEQFLAWLATETGRSEKALAKALATPAKPARWSRLLAACGGDMDLTRRIEPFHALLRQDLRGLPVVFLPDSVYVTKGLERRGSGTYYTPRALAEEVVKHALDPLVYRPGPAEGADPADWKLKPPAELLDLKVCDMAMGSGAFLVAACRYLADRLVEAWAEAEQREGGVAGPDGRLLPADPEERRLYARRLVADRCLYGVDKNPMAVEMAKLSMWLVTLAKGRPFAFLDHALRCGDSLLGITSLDQLLNFHMDPERGRALWSEARNRLFGSDATEAIRAAVGRAATLRREIESFAVVEVRDAERKEQLLTQAEQATEALGVVADTLVGAALSAPNDDSLDGRLLDSAEQVQVALDPSSREDNRAVALSELRLRALQWLQVGKPPLVPDRSCLHWPLEFPEVLTETDHFESIVGNPPFLGDHKLSPTLGAEYREWLVEHVAHGKRGRADLLGFFVLRACDIARQGGVVGFLCTNTIAQGDTREVALDQVTEDGLVIYRAVKSRPWPGEASLEIAIIWLMARLWSGPVLLDDQPVQGIETTLNVKSRVTGRPHRLARARRAAFQGSFVGGIGFVLTPEEAQHLLEKAPHNRDVVFPYLVGEDVNGRPDQSASRWIINFFDWPLERAMGYEDCFRIVQQQVKPARDQSNRQAHRDRWWQYGDRRVALYQVIRPLTQVLVIALVSKTVMPAFVPNGLVYAHRLGVFAYDRHEHFGLLSSVFHWWWAVTYASTLRTDVSYTLTDCFETFPQPVLTDAVGDVGRRLDQHRRALMLERWEGLTKTYNRVHDPDEHTEDIAELRRLHIELDHAVAAAYGWDNLNLDHDFHETRQGIRYTLGPVVRQEMLDRLLELNHERYADEVRRGLHDKKGAAKRGKGPRRLASSTSEQPTLEGL